MCPLSPMIDKYLLYSPGAMQRQDCCDGTSSSSMMGRYGNMIAGIGLIKVRCLERFETYIIYILIKLLLRCQGGSPLAC